MQRDYSAKVLTGQGKNISEIEKTALSSDKGTSGEENQPLCEAHIFFRRLKDRKYHYSRTHVFEIMSTFQNDL